MAGVISGVTAAIALALFGRFYSIDMLSYPVLDAALVLASFIAAFLWFRVLKRRHKTARAAELRKIEAGDRAD
ncbi:hypothetical protein [Microvirga sp. 2TAF3]|uniref:hypothetical protein n=1 Tax=Microvirga sp. 2TAF3 TaxID=3233014 RepID=UPI003F9E5E7C